jgi:hypothetical protein
MLEVMEEVIENTPRIQQICPTLTERARQGSRGSGKEISIKILILKRSCEMYLGIEVYESTYAYENRSSRKKE